MKQTFQVHNVKCNGCATTLKERLFETFGEVTVDLSVEPREITLEIAPEKVDSLAKALKQLGYPLVGESMGLFESASTKAMSFVSCAVGKMGS